MSCVFYILSLRAWRAKCYNLFKNHLISIDFARTAWLLSHCASKIVTLQGKRLITADFRASSKASWFYKKGNLSDHCECLDLSMEMEGEDSNLPPSLPPAGSDPWELHLAAFGRVERCDGDIRGTAACSAVLSSWRALQKDKQMLAEQIPTWKVFDKVGSFLPCLVGGGEVESRARKTELFQGQAFQREFWEGGWHRGTFLEVTLEPLAPKSLEYCSA